MNKCHVSKELSSYLDNQLAEDKKLQIEKHLAQCSLCSRELSRLKALSERLKAWQAPSLDLSFDNAVKNKIVLEELEKGEVKMKKKTLAILIPSGALAGILVIAFLGALTRGNVGRIYQSTDGIGSQYAEQLAQKTGVVRAQRAESGYKGGYDRDLTFGETFGNSSVRTGSNTSRVSRGGVQEKGGTFVGEGVDYAGSDQMQAPAYSLEEYPTGGEGPIIVVQPTLPATGEGEKIIRTAQVKLEVEDGKGTYKNASLICQEFGGYLAESRFYKDAEGRESGTIVMRIPKDKFLSALDKLSALGKVKNIATDSQDVSQQYANLKSRLDAAMVVYNKMLEALKKKQVTIDEAARLESELTPIMQRIEGLKNQIEYLNNAVSFTTITVTFYEPAVSTKVFKESRRYIEQGALAAVINGMKFLAKAIPVAVVAGLCLLLAAGIVYLIKFWIIRLFRRG